ncbi:MAG TPA: S9 family peptidase [Acidimicrobiia bacterium]|nr:S9 family peptidase [Acidimicrobiia bacterium]
MRRPLTPEDLWRLPRVAAATVTPDGRVVVPVTTFDVAANKGNGRIWLIEQDGSPRPLTAPGFNAAKPAVAPTGERVAFIANNGDGPKQLYVSRLEAEADPESYAPLTDFPFGVLGAKWMPAGTHLVVLAYLLKGHLDVASTVAEAARRQDARFAVHVTEDAVFRYWDTWLTTGEIPHLFLLDIEGRELLDLTPGAERWWSWPNTDDPVDTFDISPDGLRVAYSADASAPPHRHFQRHLFEVDVKTRAETDLTPEGVAHAVRPRYAPDGRTIAYGYQVVPDFYGDRVRLAVVDRVAGTHRTLTEAWDRSAEQWEFDGQGDLLTIAEEHGRSHVFRIALAGDEPQLIAAGGTLGAPAVGFDGTVYLLHHSLSQPPEVVRLGAEGSLQPVTDFARRLLGDVMMGKVEDLTIKGADQDAVQMFLVHPPLERAGPPPLVHLIHGGPHGMFGDGWQWRWHAQTVAARGFLVAMVNFHGSTSFGQAFTTSIQGAWGDLPYRDIEAATDFLVGRGLVDEARMAIAGGSYGGYLTAFITGQTNRYACAIAHAAVTNLGGMYASDVTAGRALAYGAEIFDDRAAVDRYSPSSHASGYSTPTLVIHGEKDYRVPATQGLELYGVLKAKRVPSRLVFYPGENHWILNPQSSLHWYGQVFEWLDLYLK